MTDQNPRPAARARRLIGPAAVGLAGLAVGAVLAGTTSASAADTPAPATQSPSQGSTHAGPQQGGTRDETKSQRPDETLLTGATADKVRAAALAKYPGATVQRVETDSDGVYEAHLVTSDGTRVTVEVDKALAVTGTEQAGHAGTNGGTNGGSGA